MVVLIFWVVAVLFFGVYLPILKRTNKDRYNRIIKYLEDV